MRVLHATIILFFGTLLCAEEKTPADLKEALDGNWSVVRVSHYHFVGDFDSEYPVIFIQQLPDKRLLMSHAVQRRWDRLVPAPLRFLGTDEWQRIKTQILEHFSIAFNSDPESQIRRHPMGGDLQSIEVSVTGSKTENFGHNFSLSDDSATRFQKFIESLTKLP